MRKSMYEIALFSNFALSIALLANFIKNQYSKLFSLSFTNAIFQIITMSLITFQFWMPKGSLFDLSLYRQEYKFYLIILLTLLNLIFIFKQRSFGILGKKFLWSAVLFSLIFNAISFAAFVAPIILGTFSDNYNNVIRN